VRVDGRGEFGIQSGLPERVIVLWPSEADLFAANGAACVRLSHGTRECEADALTHTLRRVNVRLSAVDIRVVFVYQLIEARPAGTHRRGRRTGRHSCRALDGHGRRWLAAR
jgi:hypothetical protein